MSTTLTSTTGPYQQHCLYCGQSFPTYSIHNCPYLQTQSANSITISAPTVPTFNFMSVYTKCEYCDQSKSCMQITHIISMTICLECFQLAFNKILMPKKYQQEVFKEKFEEEINDKT